MNSTSPIILEVAGIPQPQGSKTALQNKHSGKIAMVEGRRPESREAFKSWRAAVAASAREWVSAHPQPPIAEPVRLSATFRFARPASDRYRTLHTTRPDCDKLARAVLDALVHGGLLRDDSLVCQLLAEKRYASAGESVGCTVEVEPLGWYESARRSALKADAAEARHTTKAAS